MYSEKFAKKFVGFINIAELMFGDEKTCTKEINRIKYVRRMKYREELTGIMRNNVGPEFR